MAHERYRQTDDRHTDGRPTTYSEREREFTFAKDVRDYLYQYVAISQTRYTTINCRILTEKVIYDLLNGAITDDHKQSL